MLSANFSALKIQAAQKRRLLDSEVKKVLYQKKMDNGNIGTYLFLFLAQCEGGERNGSNRCLEIEMV